MLAKEEWLALKAWNADESTDKPERPATPNLDTIQKEHDMPENMKSASKKAKSTGTGRARLGVSYVVDGRIMQMKNRPYTLGYLAFEHSAGINGDRMSTADFRALLVKLGVADPNAPFSPVVLANGKQIEGIVLGSTTASPVNGKSAEPVGVKPTEKASTPRARAAAKADKKTAPKATAAKKTAAPKKAAAKSQPQVTPIPKASSKPRARKTTAKA
jgi:hypothetical protein